MKGVDPAGIEPAHSSVKNEVLAFYTTGPGPRRYFKTKRTPLQGFSLLTDELARNVWAPHSYEIRITQKDNYVKFTKTYCHLRADGLREDGDGGETREEI